MCAEIGDFARFAHPRLLAGFLGITPSEHTSDDTRRQGAITKAGPSHARRLLVEAAHHYRRPPRLGVALQRRQAGADPRVCAVAWRALQRLYRQWQRLHTQRRRPSGVVAVACARELSAFLWEAATIT
ncbi:MAG TPA: transposase [Euzebyales bacterium]|nr:transposase [Euzebyales bacterium]